MFNCMDIVPSPHDADKLMDTVNKLMLHYSWLTRHALQHNFLGYNFTHKCHMLFHVAWHGRFLNPKPHWAYSFEQFVSNIKDSAAACSHGSGPHLVPHKVAENYSIALQLVLNQVIDI